MNLEGEESWAGGLGGVEGVETVFEMYCKNTSIFNKKKFKKERSEEILRVQPTSWS